ncbi:MAG: YajQ family cyclic di-GMP-binding protein [Gammaproteobacteria bacterium]|nr:YajQ family cyclic di-GMP-binding protein [Gammaproteobacteria bacterium]NIN61028.1 YajQ family cyclic di-GMP-binding protein [Gammaproteobacteria bacterium]NIO62651.1 YajQ family cyclic di-GMP-binding protein [Gammaproteobacteria bacterium]NIP49432.1 YajQ family cyclic di-GMP-binding protein [Gammaproteobacteria bacterium]NIQ10656.1 YajQ family cyclic di-GMP-binding protein [Gammaproteobacteria bacterium]
MPSFDIVSEIDMHELSNSIDQANREITNRFDFKGTNSRVELKENIITLVAPAEFQIKQIEDILTTKMSKRGIDIKCLEKGEVTENINEAKKAITVRQGIDKELAKTLVKLVKDTKLKVQSSIQGEQVRVTGKKRDDLQEVIQMLKNSKLDFPLQFTNFRD